MVVKLPSGVRKGKWLGRMACVANENIQCDYRSFLLPALPTSSCAFLRFSVLLPLLPPCCDGWLVQVEEEKEEG